MREDFTISFKNSHTYPYLWKLLTTLLITIAIFMFYSYVNKSFKPFDISSIISMVLLFLILYIMILSISTENLSNELPSTIYPMMPHMGLDGISMNSYMAGIA